MLKHILSHLNINVPFCFFLLPTRVDSTVVEFFRKIQTFFRSDFLHPTFPKNEMDLWYVSDRTCNSRESYSFQKLHRRYNRHRDIIRINKLSKPIRLVNRTISLSIWTGTDVDIDQFSILTPLSSLKEIVYIII